MLPQRSSTASAFVVSTEKRHLLTNAHAVSGNIQSYIGILDGHHLTDDPCVQLQLRGFKSAETRSRLGVLALPSKLTATPNWRHDVVCLMFRVLPSNNYVCTEIVCLTV